MRTSIKVPFLSDTPRHGCVLAARYKSFVRSALLVHCGDAYWPERMR